MNVYFATGNVHKKNELAGILSPYTVKIPAELGITDFEPEEIGSDFIENALIKARVLYSLLKKPVIADDSGLCVDALDGRPGLYSSSYGGDTLSSHERNALLLKEMTGMSHRSARFVCTMVLLLDENRFCAVQETLEGEIICKEKGIGGFGYDPVFYVPSLGRTVAELSDAEKNGISHRGKAGRAIKNMMGLFL